MMANQIRLYPESGNEATSEEEVEISLLEEIQDRYVWFE
jgi:hypothetical protein